MQQHQGANVVIGYHYPCPDGVFSALAAYVTLRNTSRTLRYCPLTVFQKEEERIASIPQKFAGADVVYLLDFSGGPKFIAALCSFVGAGRVFLLDHHKTGKEDIDAMQPAPGNLTVVFDMDRSGATIAKDYFDASRFLTPAQLEVIAYVEDNDLWRHKLASSKEFTAGLASLKLEFDANVNAGLFDMLLSLRADSLISAGVAELAAAEAKIAAAVAQAFVISFPVASDGSSITMLAVVTDAPDLRSGMGNALALKSAERGFPPVGAVVYEEPGLSASESLFKVSFRSTGDCDTTPLARSFGGGGHKNASSCNVPRPLFLSWRAVELEQSTAQRSGSGRAREPLLFTPGPLTTSATTKAAMCIDYGSRDARFLGAVADIRKQLLTLGGVSQAAGYECVLMQGSGTFSVECVLNCSAPPAGGPGRLLIVENGAYGRRMATIARMAGTPHTVLSFHERGPIDVRGVLAAIAADASISHVAVVHHETTAGVLNPVHELGCALADAAKARGQPLEFIVDSMSAFGVYPLDLAASHVHFAVSSSNKCIEGVPGFAFALCEAESLKRCAGRSRSLALDLFDQWEVMEKTGQFRFTPPTHVMLAFRQALTELDAEGGAPSRLIRYTRNFATLRSGMEALGFGMYVQPASAQGCIISTFLFPDAPTFDFPKFYADLASRGFVIYPGKLTHANCFRIGNIGRLFPADVQALVRAVREVLESQGVALPVTQISA